jgi:hypothetical protein
MTEFLEVSHYPVLPCDAITEQENLIRCTGHGGVLAIAEGSRKMMDMMREKYLRETVYVPGSAVFPEIVTRTKEP